MLVTEIYKAHYNQLVRLAVMLVHDVQTAEEVVQDAFEAMHLAGRRLRDREKSLSYLRQTIVNRSRSELRHRKVVEMHPPKAAPDEQSAEHAALILIERSAVTSALRALPERQREASSCGTTATSPRPISPRRWESAAARSRATRPGRWRRSSRSWSGSPKTDTAGR